MRGLERKGSDQLVRWKSRKLRRGQSSARTWLRLDELLGEVSALYQRDDPGDCPRVSAAVYDAMEVWCHCRSFLFLVSDFAPFRLGILFGMHMFRGKRCEKGTVECLDDSLSLYSA